MRSISSLLGVRSGTWLLGQFCPCNMSIPDVDGSFPETLLKLCWYAAGDKDDNVAIVDLVEYCKCVLCTLCMELKQPTPGCLLEQPDFCLTRYMHARWKHCGHVALILAMHKSSQAAHKMSDYGRSML